MSASANPELVRRNPKAVVDRLREEAQQNPVFNAVATWLATRDRTRQQITMSHLRITMQREGFNFKREQYEDVLKFLATLGIGRIELDRGQISALKDIRVTLQSVGTAALGTESKLDKFAPAINFQSLPVKPAPPKPQAKPPTLAAPLKPEPPSYATSLVVQIDGNTVTFPLPKGLTTSELGYLLNQLYSRKEA